MTIFADSIHVYLSSSLPIRQISKIQKILEEYRSACTAIYPTSSEQIKKQALLTLSTCMYPTKFDMKQKTQWKQCERFIATYLKNQKKEHPHLPKQFWQQTALHVARTALLLFLDCDHFLYSYSFSYETTRSLAEMKIDLQKWLMIEDSKPAMPFLLYTHTQHLERINDMVKTSKDVFYC